MGIRGLGAGWSAVLVGAFAAATACGGSDAGPDASPSGGDGAVADAFEASAPNAPDANGLAVADSCGFVMPNPTAAKLPNVATYETAMPGIVVDQVTGLMWERQVTGHTASTGCTVNLTGILSCPFRYAAAYCRDNRLGGFSDWRVPSVLELISIADSTVTSPSIDGTAFPDTPAEDFWSSTRVARELDLGWFVSFRSGTPKSAFIDEPRRVRCVRTGPAPPRRCGRPRLTIAGELVTDAFTGLSWQRTGPSQSMDWRAADAYCGSVGAGFRLPSMRELFTIVDFGKPRDTGALIDLNVFSGPGSRSYWTGSLLPDRAMTAWVVTFSEGLAAAAELENNIINVRCVR